MNTEITKEEKDRIWREVIEPAFFEVKEGQHFAALETTVGLLSKCAELKKRLSAEDYDILTKELADWFYKAMNDETNLKIYGKEAE